MQDSTRYASVLRERETAEAKRDTVLRSLNIIRAIDDDRYIWPHVMDEVSSALTPYTWIVALGFSGGGQATAPITHRHARCERQAGWRASTSVADGDRAATRCRCASSATRSTSRRSRDS